MPTSNADPYSSEQLWRRLLALVEWSGRSERAFCAWCDINYNQWNNYKQKKLVPSRTMTEKIMHRTRVDYAFIRFGDMSRLPRDIDDVITQILKQPE
jgi:hypothetical protein